MMLADAADERLIPANPIRPLRRGRRHHHAVTEAVWVTPEQALPVALNAARLTTPDVGLLMITAAWTGARWGELTGLHRDNTHLHPDGTGSSAHRPAGRGAARGRRAAVPRPTQDRRIRPHHRPAAVPGRAAAPAPATPTGTSTCSSPADGAFLRRSNFSRRAMRPAADGTTHHPRPAVAVAPVAPGLTFHGFRHSHKTWLIADQIPDVAQARRLGHRIPDKIQHIYSHVAPELETRLLDALQQRWTDALAAADPSSTTPTPTNQTPTNQTPTNPTPTTRTSTNWTSANWTALVTPRLALPPSTGTTERAAS